ncbi:SMP-30/gluconolactonase/LRE family protein [Sulfitobacter sp. TSTF-M16]|uniref:SMP-30/gluconolactonase/LRE family protein n=1 Tax=Sulfitobacter aestuariivivens TaxID=2766981 RepID=A0A927D0K4_9RHOB|nr:SMP-30/gluconolactonase/LRE family protein [Sulfitobacter aestuariivivens]MBD3662850.1 SMP-30/gluconolactonase/LRE family protein [Sulfitobacter aestuariivivens]
MKLYDHRICTLGEGPLWHPLNNTLYWFDIVEKKMFGLTDAGPREWQFDEHYSAAGWVDETTLLIASETALWRFDLTTGTRDHVIALEADKPVTRSNDGRADPWGGFWIGTMGKAAETGAGAFYRYYRGDLRQLIPTADIPNAICFAPDRSCAYYTGVELGIVMRQPLEQENGWPDGPPTVFIDLRDEDGAPDGAVTDTDGNLWLARWGGACVSCFAPDRTHLRDISVPALQVTCPAFGGPDLRDLYVTSATEGIAAENLARHPGNGRTHVALNVAQGLPEPQVIL